MADVFRIAVLRDDFFIKIFFQLSREYGGQFSLFEAMAQTGADAQSRFVRQMKHTKYRDRKHKAISEEELNTLAAPVLISNRPFGRRCAGSP
jgi:hypothetical protein